MRDDALLMPPMLRIADLPMPTLVRFEQPNSGRYFVDTDTVLK